MQAVQCPAIYQQKMKKKEMITKNNPKMSNFPRKIKLRSKKGHHFCGCLIFHAKSNEEQKKGHHVRRSPIFHAKSSQMSKKGHLSSQKQHHARKKMKKYEK